MSLQPGNRKLGPLFHQWSVPAGETCPGKTAICDAVCYAKAGRFLMQNVKKSHQRNWQTSLGEDFVPWMCEEIRKLMVERLRIHPAGDYYDAEYTEKWLTIIRRNPRVTFLAYTRSWRDEDIYPVLKKMARQENLFLWFSCDKETGAPQRLKNVRRAYMAVEDNDRPRFKVDLVFRDQQHTVIKWDESGALVCPYDNAVTVTTCSRCGLCWHRREIPRANQRSTRGTCSGVRRPGAGAGRRSRGGRYARKSAVETAAGR